jgi:hypothetical protein
VIAPAEEPTLLLDVPGGSADREEPPGATAVVVELPTAACVVVGAA